MTKDNDMSNINIPNMKTDAIYQFSKDIKRLNSLITDGHVNKNNKFKKMLFFNKTYEKNIKNINICDISTPCNQILDTLEKINIKNLTYYQTIKYIEDLLLNNIYIINTILRFEEILVSCHEIYLEHQRIILMHLLETYINAPPQFTTHDTYTKSNKKYFKLGDDIQNFVTNNHDFIQQAYLNNKDNNVDHLNDNNIDKNILTRTYILKIVPDDIMKHEISPNNYDHLLNLASNSIYFNVGVKIIQNFLINNNDSVQKLLQQVHLYKNDHNLNHFLNSTGVDKKIFNHKDMQKILSDNPIQNNILQNICQDYNINYQILSNNMLLLRKINNKVLDHLSYYLTSRLCNVMMDDLYFIISEMDKYVNLCKHFQNSDQLESTNIKKNTNYQQKYKAIIKSNKSIINIACYQYIFISNERYNIFTIISYIRDKLTKLYHQSNCQKILLEFQKLISNTDSKFYQQNKDIILITIHNNQQYHEFLQNITYICNEYDYINIFLEKGHQTMSYSELITQFKIMYVLWHPQAKNKEYNIYEDYKDILIDGYTHNTTRNQAMAYLLSHPKVQEKIYNIYENDGDKFIYENINKDTDKKLNKRNIVPYKPQPIILPTQEEIDARNEAFNQQQAAFKKAEEEKNIEFQKKYDEEQAKIKVEKAAEREKKQKEKEKKQQEIDEKLKKDKEAKEKEKRTPKAPIIYSLGDNTPITLNYQQPKKSNKEDVVDKNEIWKNGVVKYVHPGNEVLQIEILKQNKKKKKQNKKNSQLYDVNNEIIQDIKVDSIIQINNDAPKEIKIDSIIPVQKSKLSKLRISAASFNFEQALFYNDNQKDTTYKLIQQDNFTETQTYKDNFPYLSSKLLESAISTKTNKDNFPYL